MGGIDPRQMARDVDDYAEEWQDRGRCTGSDYDEIQTLRSAADIIRQRELRLEAEE